MVGNGYTKEWHRGKLKSRITTRVVRNIFDRIRVNNNRP